MYFEYFFSNIFFSFTFNVVLSLSVNVTPVKNKSGLIHVKMAYGSYVTKVNIQSLDKMVRSYEASLSLQIAVIAFTRQRRPNRNVNLLPPINEWRPTDQKISKYKQAIIFHNKSNNKIKKPHTHSILEKQNISFARFPTFTL